jgi:hypothetical protein
MEKGSVREFCRVECLFSPEFADASEADNGFMRSAPDLAHYSHASRILPDDCQGPAPYSLIGTLFNFDS